VREVDVVDEDVEEVDRAGTQGFALLAGVILNYLHLVIFVRGVLLV